MFRIVQLFAFLCLHTHCGISTAAACNDLSDVRARVGTSSRLVAREGADRARSRLVGRKDLGGAYTGMSHITWDDATCAAIAERMRGGETLRKIADDYGVTKTTARGRMERYRDRTGAGPVRVTVKPKAVEMPGSDAESPPATLPQSLAEEWKSFEIPGRKLLTISDIHLPCHATQPLLATINYAKRNPPDTILLNGDILDFPDISRHYRKPGGAGVKRELEIARQFLFWLRGEFPRVEIIWKEGNHEERWAKNIGAKNPEIYDIISNSWSDCVGARETSVRIIRDQAKLRFGNWLILHGHECSKAGASGVNPADKMLNTTRCNTAFSHVHRESQATAYTALGEKVTCISQGCFEHLNPEWMRINKWHHGFSEAELHSNGKAYFELRTVDGNVIGKGSECFGI